MKYPPVHYHSYLGLDGLLNSHKRRSEELGFPAHDEHLFITIHQIYELWFKQILIELDSVLEIFSVVPTSEQKMLQAHSRLERVVKILHHSLGQIDILETMTPLDFLDFRDFLYPASGFQSFQFRLVETRLGLRMDDRLHYNQTPFFKHLSENHQQIVQKAMSEPTLWDRIDNWLARTPFISAAGYDFWQEYKDAVVRLFEEDKQTVLANSRLNDEGRKKSLETIEQSLVTFKSLFDADEYEKLRSQKFFRLNYKAVHAALFIQIYRDEPALQVPFKIVSSLCDLDEILTQWRYRHSLMALRMLGRKIGTGGSSGHQYLKDATEQHKVFSDFFNLTTFLIPRSKIPNLPKNIREKLNFHF